MSDGSTTLTWEDTQLQLVSQNTKLLRDFQRFKYANFAFLSILVYDHLLTFDLEVKRIWTLRWKLPKYLFVLNRYILPPFLFFEAFSNVTYNLGKHICTAKKFTASPILVFLVTVELMLILRILALYGNSKKMARFFVILFGLQTIIWTAISIPILIYARGFPGRHIFSGCLYVAPDYIFAGWVPGFIFESILVCLTIRQGLKYRINDLPPTVEVLIRDSVVYFLSVNVILAFNILYSIFGEKLLASTLFLPSGVVTSIAAARLTMNIRQFTMDEGMATLDVTMRSFMPAALTQENRYDLEPGTVRVPLRAQGISIELDNEED